MVLCHVFLDAVRKSTCETMKVPALCLDRTTLCHHWFEGVYFVTTAIHITSSTITRTRMGCVSSTGTIATAKIMICTITTTCCFCQCAHLHSVLLPRPKGDQTSADTFHLHRHNYFCICQCTSMHIADIPTPPRASTLADTMLVRRCVCSAWQC